MHSRAVFVGKVVKIEEDKENPSGYRATFEIEKKYKGKIEKVETLQLLSLSCETQFETGKKYFVYDLARGSGCNPSKPLSEAKFDIEYAESLSETDPVFRITGFFDSITFMDGTSDFAEGMKVSIEKGETKYSPRVDEYGTFDLTTKEKGIYTIKILFNHPIQFSLSWTGPVFPANAKYSTTATQTSLEYEAEFKPNGCDSRYFYVFPKKDDK